MKAPLPLREREGPIAQQWEGEGRGISLHRPLTRLATLGTLSRKGEGLMIVGIGSDLCNIERIERSLGRWGDKFLNRVFTETERAKAASRPHTRAGTLAKRFAAKEAFSKAVGTGFKRGVFMKDIGVVNLPSGRRRYSSPAEPRRGLTPLRRKATPSTYT